MNKPADVKTTRPGRRPLDFTGLEGSLSALAAGSETTTNRSEAGVAATIAMELVDEDPNQPRTQFKTETLRELADSIRELGLQSPVLVQPMPSGRYLLLQGGRRYRACKLLGMSEIKALFASTKDPYAQMVENLQRDDLTPMEIARFVGRELSHGVKQHDVATKLGKSKVWVSKFATLARAPEFIVRAADAGKLPSMEGIYELVTHLEKNPSDRDAVEAALSGEEAMTRVEIVRFLATLRFVGDKEPSAHESGTEATEDDVITGRLSMPGRSGDASATVGADRADSVGTPGVLQHADNDPDSEPKSGAKGSEPESDRGGTGRTRTVQNRPSGGARNVSRENVPAVGGGKVIRTPKLNAMYGSRKVEVDLTRVPSAPKALYVRFEDGGEAVANGDALSDLVLSEM